MGQLARLIVYAAYIYIFLRFFGTRTNFIPARARVKFGPARLKFGTGKSFTLQNLSEPNQFFCTRTIFIRAVPKIFVSVNRPKNLRYSTHSSRDRCKRSSQCHAMSTRLCKLNPLNQYIDLRHVSYKLTRIFRKGLCFLRIMFSEIV